jgi:hypothetical protein
MTTNPKTRIAQAANGAELDPVFAAIAEHKALIKESNRIEESCRTLRAEAEKNMENGYRRRMTGRVKQLSPHFTIDGTSPAAPSARLLCEWPGRSRRRWPVRPLYLLNTRRT